MESLLSVNEVTRTQEQLASFSAKRTISGFAMGFFNPFEEVSWTEKHGANSSTRTSKKATVAFCTWTSADALLNASRRTSRASIVIWNGEQY